MGIVYVLINKINGKVYVGQTVRTFKHRNGQRLSEKTILGRAIRKHGPDSFSHFENEVPELLMDNFERSLIKLYDCISPKGYNLDSGGNKNKHHCDATCVKISNSHKGKHLSQEHKQKLVEANKGNTIPRLGV